MKTNMGEYKYSVVQFLQRPNPNIDKYVCVPSSWIKTRRESDNKVGVLYPDENIATIQKLVEKNQKIRPYMNFNEFLCELLFNTNEYNSAKIFIMMKNTKDSKEANVTLNKSSEKGARRSSLCSGSTHKVKEAPGNSCLKRSHTACNTKNALNIPTPAKKSMNYKSIVFLKEIGALTAKLAEVINSYAASFDDFTSEDMETSHMQEENDDTGDETENPRKKRVISFDLPPDYDDNDSKWTLKYREPGENLKELMPDSKVYIEECELGYCLKYAQSELQLTKSLLVAIFNENALRTCSITGCKAFAHKTEGTRPGLDKVAKDTIVKYVHAFGKEKGWEQMTESALNACIRNKLTEIRKKSPQKSQK